MYPKMRIPTIALLALAAAGCDQLAVRPRPAAAEPVAPASAPAPEDSRELAARDEPPASARPRQAEYLRDLAVHSEDRTGRATAVEEALEWMKKYSRAAEQLTDLQEANRRLENENQRHLAEIARLRTELDSMKQQLSEADSMLVAMRKELDAWKENVLGFREEIRRADQAQIEALQRVLVLLGGEIPDEAQAATTRQSVAAAAGGVGDAAD